LKIASHAIGGTLTAGVVSPVVGLAIHPWMKETVYGTEDFINIGKVDEFPVGVPKKMTITSSKMDAWNIFEGLVMGSVWVIRREDNSLNVFSTNCPHLGCGINWGEDVKQFLCPCHEVYLISMARQYRGLPLATCIVMKRKLKTILFW